MYPHVHPFTLVTIRYTYTDTHAYTHIEPFPSTENEDGKPNQRKV